MKPHQSTAMPLTLAAPGPADIEALYAFELENRDFFEATIDARPASCYCIEGVTEAVAQAMAEAAADRGYQFLVKQGDGGIVGRVTLGGVRRAHFHGAVLGYRIAPAACGKGHAGQAVGQVLAIAFGELGLARIEADCRVDNAASARVLLRNGFVQFGCSRRSFELHGRWYDRLHVECHAPSSRNEGAAA